MIPYVAHSNEKTTYFFFIYFIFLLKKKNKPKNNLFITFISLRFRSFEIFAITDTQLKISLLFIVYHNRLEHVVCTFS